MKYIDADKLIAEIERRLQENADKALVFGAAFAGRTAEDNDLRNIVTSLQQEQPEVDLDNHTIMEEIRKCGCNPNEFDVARHFYGLGLKARKEA